MEIPLWVNLDHDAGLIHHRLILNPVAPPFRIGKACFTRTMAGNSVDPQPPIQAAILKDWPIADTPAAEGLKLHGEDLCRENLEDFTGQPESMLRSFSSRPDHSQLSTPEP